MAHELADLLDRNARIEHLRDGGVATLMQADGPVLQTWPASSRNKPDSPASRQSPALQRRGRDSNSRYANQAHNGFRDHRIQPLCHPSRGLSRLVDRHGFRRLQSVAAGARACCSAPSSGRGAPRGSLCLQPGRAVRLYYGARRARHFDGDSELHDVACSDDVLELSQRATGVVVGDLLVAARFAGD